MELRQLRYVVLTAQEGSFSRAAAELHLAQPSLSTAIAQLESELGIRIFERSSRGVTPTAAGAYVVRQAARVLRSVDELRDTARSMASGAQGAVSFGIVPVLAWQVAPAIMREFIHLWPHAEVALREANASDVIDLVLAGDLDVGLVATTSSAHLRDLHRGKLVVEAMGSVELIAALPRRYADSPDPICLEAFAHEAITIPPQSTRTFGLRSGMLAAFDQAGLPTPQVRDVPSLFEAIPLAMAGLAVAIIPEAMRPAIQSPDLVLRHIVDGPAPLDVSLLRRAGHATPTIGHFIEVAGAILRPDDPAPQRTTPDQPQLSGMT